MHTLLCNIWKKIEREKKASLIRFVAINPKKNLSWITECY